MLRMLRAADGGPALRVRVVAALLVIGLIAIAAPVVLPLVSWLLGLIWPS